MVMTVGDKLQRIKLTKDRIRAAVNQKGGRISDSTKFEAYPEAISAIPQNIIEGPPTSFDVYSEEEQVVGVWIDGKPIYERTYNVGSVKTNSSGVYTVDTFDDIDLPIEARGVINKTYSFPAMTNVSVSGIDRLLVYSLQFSSTKLVVKSAYVDPSYKPIAMTTPHDVYITIRYTKTTDEVPES